MESPLSQRLAETVAWVLSRVDRDRAGVTTRSPELRPPWPNEDPIGWLWQSRENARLLLDHVALARRLALTRHQIDIAYVDERLAGGRILCTDFSTDQSGAATDPSNGFLDDDDIPGWDTWFHHVDNGRFGGLMYCWIPPQLVDLADIGMRQIPVESAWWVNWVDGQDMGRLKEEKDCRC